MTMRGKKETIASPGRGVAVTEILRFAQHESGFSVDHADPCGSFRNPKSAFLIRERLSSTAAIGKPAARRGARAYGLEKQPDFRYF
jgi:hypothetical protein